MVKHSSFRLDSSSRIVAGLKSPLVVALCAMLLIQPALGEAQEPAQSPQSSAPSTTEISRAQPFDELPSAPVPQATSGSQQPAQPQQQAQPAQQQSQAAQPQQNQPAQQSPAAQGQQQGQQSQEPQQPVGTAAAPYEKPTGVPGSRPAGAAIAPAKQRRVRAIVISLGLVLAGAGAIGAIAGMSKASHSQP